MGGCIDLSFGFWEVQLSMDVGQADVVHIGDLFKDSLRAAGAGVSLKGICGYGCVGL